MAPDTSPKMTITTRDEHTRQDRAWWRGRTPDERLDAVEPLRIEAGKVLQYEYPDRMQRVVTIRKKTRRQIVSR